MKKQSSQIWALLIIAIDSSDCFQFSQLHKSLNSKLGFHDRNEHSFFKDDGARNAHSGTPSTISHHNDWFAIGQTTTPVSGTTPKSQDPGSNTYSQGSNTYSQQNSNTFSPQSSNTYSQKASTPHLVPSAVDPYSIGGGRGELGVPATDVYRVASAHNQARLNYQQTAGAGQKHEAGSYSKDLAIPASDAYASQSAYYPARPSYEENVASGSEHSNIQASPGTLSTSYASPGSGVSTHDNSYHSISSQGSLNPYEAGSTKDAAAEDSYSHNAASAIIADLTSYGSTVADNSYAAGGFGGAGYGDGDHGGGAGHGSGGSGGHGGGGYGSGSHGGGHGGGGSEKGNVVYMLVPGGGSGKGKGGGIGGGQKGADPHSHLLSAIAPLFLLSTLFLPLGLGIGTAAAAASTGRRRRSVSQNGEDAAGVANFLAKIGPSEALRVHQEMIARYMMCSGLADESNHCLEGLACLESNPQNHETATSLVDLTTLQITVEMLKNNEYLPVRMRDRLRRGGIYGQTNPRQCQAKYICTAPTSLPVKRFPTIGYTSTHT